jgi:predicted nucleotidyltransferase
MYTIAKFGSTCRADSDQHSDQDLLIICPPYRKADLLNKYQKQNYSVSFFTQRQLEKMQEKGSLFLQHLKAESQVIADSGGEFRQFIESCDFIPPQTFELIQCETALTTVLVWPNDPRTDTWKADWLYCLLRDYLVKRLAAEGSLTFGISDIIKAAKRKWGISDDHLRCLQQLRLNKALFREQASKGKFESSLFSEVKYLLETIGFMGREITFEYPVQLESIESSLNTNYQWLRALEGIYILAMSAGYTHPSHKKLMRIIQSPNLYHSSSKVMHRKVRSYYSDVIRAVTANKAMHPAAIPLRCAALHSGG